MSETVKFGDVVTIQDVISEEFRSLVGRIGTVLRALPAGRYLVQLGGDSEGVIVATAVEKVDDVVRPTSHSLTSSEHALYATENHSWRDEASELDRRRTQAAEFAHRTLGTDALLEDVIGLADWILDNPDASVKDIKRVTFNPGGVVFTPNDAETTRAAGLGPVAATIDEVTPTPACAPIALEIRDKDGDRVMFTYLAGTNSVAMVEARNTDGGVCAAYIRAYDADRIIAFLQAAKAAKA